MAYPEPLSTNFFLVWMVKIEIHRNVNKKKWNVHCQAKSNFFSAVYKLFEIELTEVCCPPRIKKERVRGGGSIGLAHSVIHLSNYPVYYKSKKLKSCLYGLSLFCTFLASCLRVVVPVYVVGCTKKPHIIPTMIKVHTSNYHKLHYAQL